MRPTIRIGTTMSAITIKFSRGKVFAIGLMSGTSHDGVSAAVVELNERSHPPARLIAFHSFPYSAHFRKELLAASADKKIGASAISTLNFALGRELATCGDRDRPPRARAASRRGVHRIAWPYIFSSAAKAHASRTNSLHAATRRVRRHRCGHWRSSRRRFPHNGPRARWRRRATCSSRASVAVRRSQPRTRRAKHRRHRQRDLHPAARSPRRYRP